MQSNIDATTEIEIIERIQSLSPDSKAHWSKMNVYQIVLIII